MIIEITATRILSPYFGNTIFSISSVISVVLAALSLGYYVGGKLADQHPQEKVFFGIIAASGVCVIFLHIVGIIFLTLFGYRLSIVEGPIIAAILLFFAQNFFLGMLSPFAIKIQAMRQKDLGIGTVSGQVFFWSTLGSIFGSLGAGFFLIPHVGINAIMIGAGLLLCVLGLVAMVPMPRSMAVALAGILLIVSFWFAHYLSGSLDALYPKFVVYNRDGLYQKIVIYDGTYNHQPARFLLQDRNSSAAEFLHSDQLAYEYTKYYALYQLFNPNIRQVLAIGGGAYSVPKALLHELPNAQIDVAEIEPSLFAIDQKYFNVPSDSRLHNMVEDGRRLLVDSGKKYDMIFSDAYSSFYSTPEHLTTQEFFRLAKSRLSDKGVFIANVIGNLSLKEDSFFLSEIKTFQSVFGNSYFFAVVSPSLATGQNIIFVGYNGMDKLDVASPKIKEDKNPIISGLANRQIDISKFNLSSQPILTDNFAPVDYLIAKELEQSHY